LRPDLKKYKDIFYLSFPCIIIFILSFPKIGGPIFVGPDPSWEFAMNYFFSKNIQHGRDVIFTYGPLGFLLCPKPVGNNLLISVIVITLFKFVFLLSFLYLNFLIKKPKTLSSRIVIITIFAVLSFLINFGYILVFFTASLLLLHAETKNKMFIVLAIAVASFSLLVKSSYGIAGVLLAFSYNIIDFIQFKKINQFILISLGLVLFFISEWLIIYQDISGILPFLRGTWELSLGYSSAMATSSATMKALQDAYGWSVGPSENNWILLSIFFITYFYLPLYIKEKRVFVLYGMFLLPFFAFFKYAFTREGGIHYFFSYIIFFYCFVFSCLKNFKARIFIIVLISLSAYFVNMRYVRGERHEIGASRNMFKDSINGLKHFEAGLLNLKHHQNILFETSKSNLRNRVLEKNVLQLIGSNPVDIYPWETTYVFANNLNWQPRPVFQSYVVHTPWLDKKNAIFFNSPQSPKFIIWDVENLLGEVSSIDRRYLLNDEPLTIYEIFNHYKLIYRDKKIALFERVHVNNLKEPISIGSEKGYWNEWIKVPSMGNGVVRAKLHVSRKIIGKIKRLIYKEEEFYIEYKLQHGEIKRYRLVIDNAVSGVWVSPLIARLSSPFWGLPVEEVRLSYSKHNFMKNEIKIEWEYVEFQQEGAPLFDLRKHRFRSKQGLVFRENAS
jgi:hypothetical protein